MTDFLLAHDLGTTGDKATLFEADGRLAASAYHPYPTRYPLPGRAEQDAGDWWDAVCVTSRELMSKDPLAARSLAAISFSGMMNGCLLVDGSGQPVRPALIHADIRSQAQCERIAAAVGDERAYQITGNRVAPYFTLGKLAWLAEHEQESVFRARWCVQTKDYVGARLTGNWGITDRSDASLTGCFDIGSGAWSDEMVSAGGIPKQLLPEVAASTAVLGRVTREAAAASGLPEGVPVVIGGGDGPCATAGSGAVLPGDAYHYMGGSSWVAAVTRGFVLDPKRRLSVFCGLSENQFVLYGTVQSAGSAVDWLRSAVGPGRPEPGEDDFASLERLAGSARPGSSGLFFLPYLMGERSPIWDASARGVFFGLSSAHGRAEMVRSVYEGVAYALGSNLAVLDEMGLGPSEVRVLGGAMRSRVWRSILANVYDRPLVTMARLTHACSCGAALAAGVGVGLFSDFESAAKRFSPAAETEQPDPATADVYRRCKPLFQDLYLSLQERFADLRILAADLSG